MDTVNYRNRNPVSAGDETWIAGKNLQILRGTMATLARGKWPVKDIQAHLRHSKADTTANEYIQESPERVGRRMARSMYEELIHGCY